MNKVFRILESYYPIPTGANMKNLMKGILFCIAVFFTVTLAHGQKQGNIWYFGDSAGVDFKNGNPIALLNGQLSYPNGKGHNEGSSVISDSSGSLLFYSDGMTVWNKTHKVMQNGNGLLGNFSSTQSSIIVPDPSDPNRYYYIFTISSGFCCGGNISDGLRYSKIDICLDSLRGGIIPTEKNLKLVDSVAEKIAVTRHTNGNDYWILTHKFYSNEFCALLLTSSGIVDTVITAIRSYHGGSIGGSQGQLKFSSNGNKIALAASNGLNLLEIFNFNKTTGVVSNSMSLYKPNNNKSSIYGVEFSSDGSKLYANGLSALGSLFSFLVQYDLSSGNLPTINASMTFLFNSNVGGMSGKGLQIGPDGKIYMVSQLTFPNTTLSVIDKPNVSGVNCNYKDQVISLGGRKGSYSLPSFIAGYDYSNEMSECKAGSVSEVSSGYDLLIYPNPFSDQAVLLIGKSINVEAITLENVLGQTVKQIKNISSHTVILNRDNLSSGLYFVRLLQNSETVATKKIVITN